MHPEFQALKKRWWWIRSPESFRRFSENPFAQGYEFLRRIESFRKQLPASFCPPDQTWKQLYRNQRDYFSLNHRETLSRLNLLKRIFAGPKGISFDVSQSDNYLLTALKYELSNPTPMACGQHPDKKYSFRTVPKFEHQPADSEVYVKRPAKRPLWESGMGPGVYLPLPPYGEGRELRDREIYAFFRNFIKDNPPRDFAAFRKQFLRKTQTNRQEKPRTLALGLLAYDYCSLPGAELKELSNWLCRTLRGKNIFSLGDTELSKAIYYSKDHVYRLFGSATTL